MSRRRTLSLAASAALLSAAALALAGGLASCASSSSSSSTEDAAALAPPDRSFAAEVDVPTLADDQPRDYPGLHNVVAFHDDFYSGSVPEGEAGFDALQALGVKTIITVDGAVPDVEAAEARGMRYIHLPIGYDGFSRERQLELVRAARDFADEGAVYVHCHHGRHRSAGAAGTIAVSLGWVDTETAVERMQVSGTAAGYTGLFACTRNAMVLSDEVIDLAPAEFPSVSLPQGLVLSMVEISHAYEHLLQIEKAGWQVPADHPDLVPVAEAGRLADLLRLLEDDDDVRAEPAEFTELLRANWRDAQRLEDMLVTGEADPAQLSAQIRLVNTSCKACHVRYRD